MRRGGAPILLGLTLLVPVAWTSASASAEGVGEPFASVNAEAAADGVRMTLTVPGAPVSSKVIDGGGPSSQARLGTFTGSRATAALPHPGETGLAGPGTAAGFLASNGLDFPAEFPPYPFYATAEYPARPEQKVGDGPYVVKAKTGDGSAHGMARSGFHQEDGSAAGLFAISTSSVEHAADRVVAEGVSNTEGLTIGPLTIGQVRSVARTEVGADGEFTRTSSMTVSGARVAGSAVEFTPSGIVVGSDPLPVPAAEFVETLNNVLAPSNMLVSLMPAQETPNGVVSPTFEIRTPTPNPRGSGEGTWQIIVGATASSVDAVLASAGEDSEPPPADEDSIPAGEGASPAVGASRGIPAAERTAETIVPAPSSSSNLDRSFGTEGGSVAAAYGSFGWSEIDRPRSTVGESGGFAAPAGYATQEPAAPLGTERPSDDVTASAGALPELAAPQAVLPAARSAAHTGDGFDIQSVYLLFGGFVVVGVLMNVLVGGVRGRWTS